MAPMWEVAMPAQMCEPAFLVLRDVPGTLAAHGFQGRVGVGVPHAWQSVHDERAIEGAPRCVFSLNEVSGPDLRLLLQAPPAPPPGLEQLLPGGCKSLQPQCLSLPAKFRSPGNGKADEADKGDLDAGGSTRASDRADTESDSVEPSRPKRKLRICKAKRDRYRRFVEQGIQKVRQNPHFDLRTMKLPAPIAFNEDVFQKFAATVHALALEGRE